MIDPSSSSSKSSPNSFFRTIVLLLIVILILIFCLVGGYFFLHSNDAKNEKPEPQFTLNHSTSTQTQEVISLSAPDIAPITTEEETNELPSKKRLELSEKAIDALSHYNQTSSSSSDQ